MGLWPSTLENLELTLFGMSDAQFVRRVKCRVCGSSELDLVLDYGRTPLAGGFFPAEDERSRQVFPMHLVRCEACTLLQVAETVNPETIFSTYSYTSSVNPTLVAHNAQLASTLNEMLPREGLIVEIGCNDGVLLKPLVRLGAKVVGVDPSDVAQRAADENGWPFVRGYFDRETASEIQGRFGTVDIVVANNVCAHLDDPNTMVESVAKLLRPDGYFVFEVHYQGDLIESGQYDSVCHEHTCYYSLNSLKWLLEVHGLGIVDVQRIPIHGGSIRVTSMPKTSSRPPNRKVEQMLEEEANLNVARFAVFAKRHGELLHDLLANLRRAGKRIVAYGASGRATILLNFCSLGKEFLDHVSDLSPLRYDRVVPGVGVPILPRQRFHENYPDYALMTAWNYEQEILRDEAEFLNKGNAFIVPHPHIRLV